MLAWNLINRIIRSESAPNLKWIINFFEICFIFFIQNSDILDLSIFRETFDVPGLFSYSFVLFQIFHISKWRSSTVAHIYSTLSSSQHNNISKKKKLTILERRSFIKIAF